MSRRQVTKSGQERVQSRQVQAQMEVKRVWLKEHITKLQRFWGGRKTSDEELRRPDYVTGKKSSLRKTHKNRAGANDKVWLLNLKHRQGLGYVGYEFQKVRRRI